MAALTAGTIGRPMGVYAGIAVAATIVSTSSTISSSSPRCSTGSGATIAGVLKRMAGVIILGGSVLAAWLFLPFDLADLGLPLAIPPSTWLWVGGASVVIVIGCIATAHKPENFDVYPEMRGTRWGVGPVAANFLSAALHIRLRVLVPRVPAFRLRRSDAGRMRDRGQHRPSTSSPMHPKGPRGGAGVNPVAAWSCASRRSRPVRSGRAFLIHVIMSQLNDYLARPRQSRRCASPSGARRRDCAGHRGDGLCRPAPRLPAGRTVATRFMRSAARSEKAKALTHERIRVFQGDIADKDRSAAPLRVADRAYHAAALVSVWAKDPGRLCAA